MLTALLTLVVASGPERAAFLFELEHTPVGTVVLSYDPSAHQYEYRSLQLFREGDRRSSLERHAQYTLDAAAKDENGRVFESLWLSRRPRLKGCLEAREELAETTGQVCANEIHRDRVTGTVFGKPFEARYQNDRLKELTLPDSRFVALGEPRALNPPDVFAHGFPIVGAAGPLRLLPSYFVPPTGPRAALWTEAEARQLVTHVRDQGSAGNCAARARAYVLLARARGEPAAVVYGLLRPPEEDAAYPHAWVRVFLSNARQLDLDPATGLEVRPETHLPVQVLPPDRSPLELGSVILELMAGKRRLARDAS